MIENDGKKIEFYQEFINEYFSRGFGNMPKRDIDILIYYLLDKHEVFKGMSDYELARKLRTTPSKIKNARYEAVLRFNFQGIEDDKYLRRELKKYFTKPVLDLEKGQLKIQIQDRILMDSLKGELTKEGLLFDKSFSGDILTLNVEKYVIFLTTIVFEKDDKEDLKEAKEAFGRLKQSGFEKVGKWIFKKATNEGGSEGLKFLGNITLELLSKNYSILLQYLEQIS